MTPDMDSDSWVIAVISAADFCCSAVTSRRRSPTNFERKKNTGAVPTATSVNCQDSTSIAISVLMNMTVFDNTFDTVLVTTFCIPPTSLEMRD